MARPWTTALLVALLLGGCGAGQGRVLPGEGRPVDLRFTEGEAEHRISELRGRPLVLALIRTSEVVSQMYVEELVRAHRRNAGRLRYLVLTLEPGESPFVEMYAEFGELPFPVGVAEPAVVRGESALGVLPMVPCTFVIDERGVVVDAAAGLVTADQIDAAVERYTLPPGQLSRLDFSPPPIRFHPAGSDAQGADTMPIYEYRCGACGHEFEVMQKITDGPKRKCEKCGRLKAKRMISQTSFVLKGQGWYVTDYGGKNASNAKKKDSGSSDSSSSDKGGDKSSKESSKSDLRKAG